MCVSVLTTPGTLLSRSATTSAICSWFATLIMTIRSIVPVTEYTSLTPLSAAISSATSGIRATSAFTNTIAVTMAVTLISSCSRNVDGSLRSRGSRLEADAFALADEKRVCPFVRPGQWRAILCAWDPVTHLHLRFPAKDGWCGCLTAKPATSTVLRHQTSITERVMDQRFMIQHGMERPHPVAGDID